jgi:protease I
MEIIYQVYIIYIVACRSKNIFWRIEKMKRSTILILILTCLATICLGQRRFRAVTQTIIQLTEPKTTGKIPFEEALNKQQDTLVFSNQTLERSQVGQLAWAALGKRSSQGGSLMLSSQTESPLKLYIANHEGLFTYASEENSLQQITNQDIRSSLASATGQMSNSVAAAGCSFIITASTRSLASQRGGNNRTSSYLQAGQIAQNIQLQAVCLEMGSLAISDFNKRGVNTACRLPRNIDPVYIICVGYPDNSTLGSGDAQNTAPKRAAVIVPSANFRDEELFETLKALSNAGVQYIIASKRMGILTGMLRGQAESGALISQIRIDDFDGIIFIGGAGAGELVYDPVVLKLIREAVNKRKIIGATSTAPSILANAGVLTGVKVTALPSERVAIEQLGAVYTGVPVEESMKIITCNGPMAAIPFARAVTDAITGR